jgi:alkylhydroperoxidase family enzyme
VSHAGFLRDFWTGESDAAIALIRRVIDLGHRANTLDTSALLTGIEVLDLAELDAVDQVLVRMALKLAVRPGSVTRSSVQALRGVGFTDPLIADAVHVVACFGYMNRLADGLGVRIEARKRGLAELLYGVELTDAHLRWSEPE